jgi:hypothetical protein
MSGILGAAILALIGGLGIVGLARSGGPYRDGPWPGLTARGAGLVLAHGVLVAAGQVLVGGPRPDLIWLCVLTVIPMALATRVVQVPGVASAVAVVYLLPRSLLSLLSPEIALPPPLLVPAVVFDVLAWLRREDLRMPRNRRHVRTARQVSPARLAIAAVAACLVLAIVEPPFAAFFSATGTGSSRPAPPTAPPRSAAADL